MTTHPTSAAPTSIYGTLKEIRTAVENAGGMMQLTLLDLRTALGYGRLGPGVLPAIVTALAGEGLSYFPRAVLDPKQNLTLRQQQEIRVYRRNTSVGELIDAVLEPSTNGDQRLLSSSEGEARVVLEKVKVLLNDI